MRECCGAGRPAFSPLYRPSHKQKETRSSRGSPNCQQVYLMGRLTRPMLPEPIPLKLQELTTLDWSPR
jgi:hypothetical protein